MFLLSNEEHDSSVTSRVRQLNVQRGVQTAPRLRPREERVPRMVLVRHESDCQQLHVFGRVGVTFELTTFPSSVHFFRRQARGAPRRQASGTPLRWRRRHRHGVSFWRFSRCSYTRIFLCFRSDPVAEPGGGAVTSSSGFASGWFRSGCDACDEEIDLTM